MARLWPHWRLRLLMARLWLSWSRLQAFGLRLFRWRCFFLDYGFRLFNNSLNLLLLWFCCFFFKDGFLLWLRFLRRVLPGLLCWGLQLRSFFIRAPFHSIAILLLNLLLLFLYVEFAIIYILFSLIYKLVYKRYFILIFTFWYHYLMNNL